jgi:uncharacterized protein (TIGR03032 family)
VKLDTEFYKLPLRFDVKRLNEEIAQFSEADWRAHPQGHAGNTAISLLAAKGDHTSDSPKGPMLPTRYMERCPYICQVLSSFTAVFGRTRLMRIAGEADANAHVDTNYYWLDRVRVHVPIVTSPEVKYVCNGKSVYMAPGESWIFNTWRMHNSINPTSSARIHLVADTVGSEHFWNELVGRAERPFDPNPNTAPPRIVPFQPDFKPVLQTEMVNFPVVMTPAEQDRRLNEMFSEMAKSEKCPAALVAELKENLTPFRRQWATLWSQYSETSDGWPKYKQLLDDAQKLLTTYARRMSLYNGMDVAETLLQCIVRPALNPELAGGAAVAPPAPDMQLPSAPVSAPSVSRIAPPLPLNLPTVSTTPEKHNASRYERPIFIVSAPRSGSSMLFETLARSPDVWTIGGEGHGLFERLPRLNPANRNFDSNRATAEDADPETVRGLKDELLRILRDRGGHSLPMVGASVRVLEKTPKNALRIPFLNAAFPDAMFIYLYREPHENISSIMEAWKSGRFVTYPRLPGWPTQRGPTVGQHGLPWSLLLIPEWRKLAGQPVVDIAAAQWEAANTTILNDLEQLSPERWCVVTYSDLLARPQEEVQRLCKFVGIGWDQQLGEKLPLSQHTLTPPTPDKWRMNAAVLERVLPRVQPIAARVKEIAVGHVATPSAFSFAAAQRPAAPVASAPVSAPAFAPVAPEKPMSADVPPARNIESPKDSPLRSVHTTSIPQLLEHLRASIMVSTYQAGKLITLRVQDGKLNTHFRNFAMPMGLAGDGSRLAIGTLNQVWEFRNQPQVGQKLQPLGKVDACFMPRSSHMTGDIKIHEISWSGDDLWIVNTRFSCLCTLDSRHSFVPRWRPRFVSGYAPEDRCHLNGLAMKDGRPRYVTALGETDAAAGWRANKANGGILIDVSNNEIICRGLSMPHSPRWYDNRLWVLESGHGRISTVDPATGKTTPVAEVPGFTRGLDFIGPYAFIGLSQVRETAVFSGLPITEKVQDRACGVWVVDIRSGSIVGFVRFEDAVQEIFAIQALPGMRFPDVVNDDNELIGNSFVLPDEALREVQVRR